jgi:high affinity choline transporter 7
MIGWNFFRSLIAPNVSALNMRRVVRLSILALGAMAALLALRVQSVQKLWFFTSDLVFVLLFPQLVYALFDPRANRTGSICAFVVGLVLRLGGGEPILAIPQFIFARRSCRASAAIGWKEQPPRRSFRCAPWPRRPGSYCFPWSRG